jgi:predicted SnoaL-like aldol condensation-catalyzing enzyme
MTNYKDQVVELLNSIETGDSKPLAYINPDKYIQHNLGVGDGLTGVLALLQATKGSAKVNTVRVFQHGDFVFAHVVRAFTHIRPRPLPVLRNLLDVPLLFL